MQTAACGVCVSELWPRYPCPRPSSRHSRTFFNKSSYLNQKYELSNRPRTGFKYLHCSPVLPVSASGPQWEDYSRVRGLYTPPPSLPQAACRGKVPGFGKGTTWCVYYTLSQGWLQCRYSSHCKPGSRPPSLIDSWSMAVAIGCLLCNNSAE